MPTRPLSRKQKTKDKKLQIPTGFVNPHAGQNEVELPRIQRIIGQLEGVRRMIQEKRHCYEVIHQVRSISKAVQSLESKIMENHLEHLLREITESGEKRAAREKTAELVKVIHGKLFLSNQ